MGLALDACDDQVTEMTPAADAIGADGLGLGDTDIAPDAPDEDPPDAAPDATDVDVDVDVGLDVGPDVGPPGPGTPCDDGDDCDSGYCVEGPNGTQCTDTCDSSGDCPPGWSCKQLAVGGDPTFLCVYDHVPHCAPCRADTDCAHPSSSADYRCVPAPDGSGSFCAAACEDDGACPFGAACVEAGIPGADGETVSQTVCRPIDDVCECSPWATANAASTDCVVGNDLGACSGERACVAEGLTACDAAVPAAESCDGLDEDCDGETDETFPEQGEACDGEQDEDQCLDGERVCVDGALSCEDDAGGLVETCNGIDDDCDGLTDAEDDGLQIDACESTLGVCAGAMHVAGDCTGGGWQPCPDAQYVAHSELFEAGAELSCDGVDNDCDGDTDEDFELTLLDGTTVTGVDASCGTGACGGGLTFCNGTKDGILCSSEAAAGEETCDGTDDDCDGVTDAFDPDLVLPLCDKQEGVCEGALKSTLLCGPDGWAPCPDVAYGAHDPAYSGATEGACDTLDDDCDGETDEDFSVTLLDGAVVEGAGVPCGTGACAGGLTVCSEAGDGLTCSTEGNAAPEVCDGVDNDCDGLTDADDPDLELPLCELQHGPCTGSVKPAGLCIDGEWATCTPFVYGALSDQYEADAEVSCDGVDNDCDGTPDDDFELELLDGTLVTGVEAGCGVGACTGGVTQCNGAGDGIVCPTETAASAELCNGADDDCDGLLDGADPSIALPLCETQGGACEGATKPATLCAGGEWQPCGTPVYAAHSDSYQPGAEQSCDDVDNDCDGLTDEDFAWTDEAGADLLVGQPCGSGACDGGQVVCADLATATCSTSGELGAEVCNGFDDDCNGLTDDGCDDDGDGWCDEDLVVVGLPEVCPSGGGDCLDDVDHAFPDAPELCNDVDDDCDGETDEDFSDCPVAVCGLGGDGYVATAAAGCQVGECVVPAPTACGLFTCAGGGVEGDACATSCFDDTTCVASAHCDEATSACVSDFVDGAVCVADSDCTSGHCQNGFCCSGGDCCAQPADCPDSYAVAPACDSAATCQGTRRDPVCADNVCALSEPLADDSACAADVLALDCAPYQPLFCTGDDAQDEPACPDSCIGDDECLDGFHCDGTCVFDVSDGGACDEPSDCQSGYCKNGFCCAGGDCCGEVDDCPDDYTAAPVCEDAFSCQGTRVDATCVQATCGSATVADDSGCGTDVVANGCGLYVALTCTGAVSQIPQDCPLTCDEDADCDPNAHCEGTCTLDVVDGGPCDEPSDCVSGHCANNVCCAGGECCATPLDCPGSFSTAPTCDFPASCQGTADVAACTGFVCETVTGSPDDSACGTATVANGCGPFPSVSCTGLLTQTEPACPAACAGDSECDTAAFCTDGGTCDWDLDDGGACDRDGMCASGHCDNGFCCSGGDCCAQPADCPAAYTVAATCDDATTCSGTRQDAVCVANVCGSSGAIDDDSACTSTIQALDCAPLLPIFCTGAPVQNTPVCGESCEGDAECVAGFHCDGTCTPDVADGGACDEASDCVSGYCSNGFCCASGDCCSAPADCPSSYTEAAGCDDEATCQGARVDATCDAAVCGSTVVDDDSACSVDVLANACGLFVPQFCSGAQAQDAQDCPVTCLDDAECDAIAHCDDTCVLDVADGGTCDEASDCISGHCQNGFCCAGGDCCSGAGDCPSSYSASPECDFAGSCQGTADVAACVGFVCETTLDVPDDSACTAGTVANGCGPFPSVSCSGLVTQVEPPCPTTCGGDLECDTLAFCSAGGACEWDLADGATCDRDSMCASGHCQNGFCCAGGDCCAQPADCPAAYTVAAGCDDSETCQGSRRDAVCDANVCVQSDPIDDDSACGSTAQALDCSPLLPVFCDGTPSQTAPVCAESCAADIECVTGFHCDGTCMPDVADGGSCNEMSDCASGYCANGFCCAEGDCCSAPSDCPAVYTGAPVCEDIAACQGQRVDATCEAATCGSTDVSDDSGCGAGLVADGCGLFAALTCSGAASQTPQDCPATCSADAECDAEAHCDGVCVLDVPDGGVCDEPSDCTSGHCQNGFCCAGGDCCSAVGDCPAAYTVPPFCDFPSTCQGTADVAVCVDSVCGTALDVADDTACSASTTAKDCGPFPSVACSGALAQTEPACPSTCTSDSDCDTDAFCNGDGVCAYDLADGGACDRDGMCVSGHCQNGYCCSGGDCCSVAANCPATYAEVALCDDAVTCQGSRVDPVCSDNVCAKGPSVGDDSACAGLEASTCGSYPSVFCTADAVQAAPSCAVSCAGDGDCDAGANCDGGVCVPDATAGEACDEASDCADGLTCVDGVCCTTACGGSCQRCDLPGSEGSCTFVALGTDPDAECGAIDCVGYYFGFDGDSCHERADVSAALATCNGSGACLTAGELCVVQPAGDAVSTCHPSCQDPTPGTCTGTTPGTCTNVAGDTQTCGVGACEVTTSECFDGAPNPCVPGAASNEVCNGVDDDCDGATDAADPIDLLLWDGRLCEDQDGVCSGSVKPVALCVSGEWQVCTAADYELHDSDYEASFELSCDDRDNDCDGAIDDDFDFDEANCGVCGNTCANANGSTQCLSGTCVPSCDAGWRDCDSDPDDGCETSVTTLSNCGQCGQSCALDNATESCASGACEITECSVGWCDLDNEDGSGCEHDLDTDPGCGVTFTNLGTVRGDAGADSVSHTARGEKRFRVVVSEDNNSAWSCNDLSATIALSVPAGTDYDLEAWCEGCSGSATVSSSLGPSTSEEVTLKWEEDCVLGFPAGTDSGRTIEIRVSHWSADICSEWTLTVTGFTGAGAYTCDPK